MFALVRFLNSFDEKEYVIPVNNIKDFYPESKEDFIKSKVYTTEWIDDEDPENTGSYTCRILLLADLEQEIHEQRGSKRLPRPRIHQSDIDLEEELIDLQLSAVNTKQTAKQAPKKMKHDQAASKSAAYEEILTQHACSALEKNKAARASQTSSKRRLEFREDTTNKELKMRREAWLEPYESVLKERNELRQTVATINERIDRIDVKLSMIVEMLQERSAPQHQKAQKSAPLPNQAQQSPTDLWEDGQDLNGLDYEAEQSHTAPTPPPPAHMDTTSTANLHRTSKPAADILCTAPTPTPPPVHMDRTSKPVGDVLPTAADPKAHTPFTDIGDGKYHVKDSLMIGSKQAEKILGHKKPSLVVKDMAQAIWGREGLAERSYGGKLAPKDYKNPKAVVRKQLSPHKVALIVDTVTHWGSRSGVPVKETLDNLSTILSQKIQDIRSTKRKED